MARSSPTAVAVEFGGETITYRELNHRANGLALRLHEAGAEPDASRRHLSGTIGRSDRRHARGPEERRRLPGAGIRRIPATGSNFMLRESRSPPADRSHWHGAGGRSGGRDRVDRRATALRR